MGMFTNSGPMQGTYTINANLPASSTNFISFSSAVDSLTLLGVGGSVIFQVAPNSGPYHEQLVIGNIFGASATRTITFDGGQTQEEIWTDQVATYPNTSGVVHLNGAHFIHLENLKIRHHGISGGGTHCGVFLENGASYNVIRGCHIETVSYTHLTLPTICSV